MVRTEMCISRFHLVSLVIRCGESSRLSMVRTPSPQYRAFVRGKLAEICADLADDVSKGKLDMHDLENGVHELRRKLRWIPITMIALDGLVGLDEKAGGPFASLKHEPVAQTSF